MNTNEIGPKPLHLLEVFNNGLPFLLPIVFEKPAGIVVVVVEPPGDEPIAAFGTDKPEAIVADADSRRGGVRSFTGQSD